MFGQIGRFLGQVEFQLHASNVCRMDSHVKPPFVHYHSGAPTSSLASLGCLGAEEDLGVPEKGGSELAKRVPSSVVDRPQCLHVVQL